MLLIATVGDIATTTYGITQVDHFEESNDTLKSVMDSHGTIVGHIIAKFAALAIFATLTALISLINPSLIWAALLPPILIWGAGAIWNLGLILLV